MYKNQDFQLEIGWEIRNISYLGLWESMNNKNFKGGEFATFKNEAGSNKFKMSPQKWIKELELLQERINENNKILIENK